jgi:hypothetical protein
MPCASGEYDFIHRKDYKNLIEELKEAITVTPCCIQFQAIEDLKEFARNNCREWNNDEMEKIIDHL